MASHIIMDINHDDMQAMSMDQDMKYDGHVAQDADSQHNDSCFTGGGCSSSGHCCSAIISVSFDIETEKPSEQPDPVQMALIQPDLPPAYKPPRTI